jgi:hypothetical protein
VPNFRYVAIDPARADGRHITAIGKAAGLYDFLINHQTDSEGWVNYGKLISYSWIRARLPNSQPARTLRRWMARLRAGGYAEVLASRSEHGMYIRILDQTKFPKVQLPLFPLPKPLRFAGAKPVEKPVEIASHGGTSLRPQMAAPSGHKWPLSSLCIEKNDEKRYGGFAAETGGDPVENVTELTAELQRLGAAKSLGSKPTVEPSDEEKAKRLELLHGQARMLQEKSKIAG